MIKTCKICGKEFNAYNSKMKYCSMECSTKSRIRDLTGQKFGRLTAIKIIGKDKNNHKIWLCKCDCGNETQVAGTLLIEGKTKSCGCLKKQITSRRFKTHGLSNTRLFTIWINMKERCNNKNRYGYQNYGGRGIKVCKEWQNDFMNFYNWAMTNGYDENAEYGECTLDRVDVNRDYSPENCRWANARIQTRNKRNNHLITYKGETHCINEWAEILGMNKGTLQSRIFWSKWSYEKALSTPVKVRK